MSAARAIVSRGPLNDGGWKIEDVKVRDVGDDELLVRIVASGICHTDILFAGLKEGPFVTYPSIKGHEGEFYPWLRHHSGGTTRLTNTNDRRRICRESWQECFGSCGWRPRPTLFYLLRLVPDLPSRPPRPLRPLRRAQLRRLQLLPLLHRQGIGCARSLGQLLRPVKLRQQDDRAIDVCGQREGPGQRRGAQAFLTAWMRHPDRKRDRHQRRAGRPTRHGCDFGFGRSRSERNHGAQH